MERVLAAGILAMAISILAGPKFIDFLRRNEFGQHIREELPAEHHLKQGTPTMGGLLILFSMAIPFLALSKYTQAGLTVFFVTLACGAIGFIDDWFKVRHRRSLGLNGRWKLLLLAAITVGVGWSAHDIGLSTDVYAPILDWRITLTAFGFYLLLFIVIAGAANGANLTDGIDGLAVGVAMIALITFAAMNVVTWIRSRPRHRPARRVRARPRDPRGRSYGRRDWVPLVQRVPRRGDHGRHRLDGPRGRDRRFRSDDEDRAAAAPDRRNLRRRGGFGDPPGRLVPLLGPAHLPDGADPPPLRDESLVRDEDHGPLLDPRRDHVRRGLRVVLPLLPRLPSPEMSWLVLGLARSGQAAALALRRRGEEVIGIDASPSLDVGRLAEAGVEVHLGTEEERLLDGVETLIKSPGVPGEAPLVQAARTRGIPVWSEVELGSRLLATTIVAVTGTNGKTTTSELLGAMLRAPVAGNVGRALTELDGSVRPGEVVVCEVSSFQLEDIHEFKPHVAVLLNLEPDHLDRHGSFEAYADAKLRIFENQDADDVAVVPRRFEQIPGRAQRLEFAPTDELPAEPLIPGAHNRENAAAATRAARALGVDDARISEALETFPGVAHRLEPVADANGILYVNDSKATNTAAARRAVAAYDQPLHVILGGRGKGESYTELALDLAGRARRAYLIGEAARAMDVALELAGVDHELSGDLETAVRSASKNAQPGEIVLLAPACASYDQFNDFEERGEAFKRLVAEVAG